MSAALQTYNENQDTLFVPDGGIAAFLYATEGDWATEDDIPETGIAQVKSVADKLAEYGRYEDEYMVHAAEGETVVPLEVLEANPRLKSNLFNQMEKMGLEPERYVVGSELNSLNPVTGQPEFFLKKLFKGVKKLVKNVVKVVKKALPVVLPIALAMTPLGPIFGAAAGSGISTLAAGGDLKDALKAGITAGALGGFASGVSGGISSLRAGNTFMEGFKSSVGSAAGGVGERFKQFASPARAREAGGTYFGDPTRTIRTPMEQQGIANTRAMQNQISANVDARMAPQVTDQTTTAVNQQLAGGQGTGTTTVTDLPPSTIDQTGQDFLASIDPRTTTPTTTTMTVPFTPTDISGVTVPTGVDVNVNDAIAALNRVPAEPRTFLERTGDFMFRGGKTQDQIKAAQELAAKQAGDLYLANTPTNLQSSAAFEAARTAAKAAAGPGTLTRFGPSALLASGIAAGTGFFDAPEEEEETEAFVTGAELLEQDPDRYMIRYPVASPTYTLSDIRVPGSTLGFADGGAAQFPRRDGAISGPGTETSDDVPAMLSDGEFVMTAKAVRGAGAGDRSNGMKTMYSLMRKFERAAV